MTPENEVPGRVSILARVLPALSCWVIMLGAAFSALALMRVMNAMRNAESAGIGAVANGMAEANLAIVITLYLALFLMTISLLVTIIRKFTAVKTAAPSALFFVIVGALAVVPLSFVWEANSLLLGALMGRANVAMIAPNIQICLVLTLVTAGLFSVILLAASVAPLPRFMRARRSWMPIVMLVLMEVMLIALSVAFYIHMSWLQRVGMRESF